MSERRGQSFEEADAAEHYRHRPEYAPGIYEKLIELSPGHDHLLDLGCGTGKIARNLCGSFKRVTAIDASANMLSVARDLQQSAYSNIDWLCGLAETVELPRGPYDLIVAAASIQWMDHAVLFPRLAGQVGPDHVFAVVDGDGAHEPPWQSSWDGFLEKWIFEIKRERYEPDRKDSDFARYMTRYRDWIDIQGEFSATHVVSQTIEGFVSCQHSRDTFTTSRLGERLTEFDDELRTLLTQHADDNVLTYTVRSQLEWGTIR